jgi:hypothetical protein
LRIIGSVVIAVVLACPLKALSQATSSKEIDAPAIMLAGKSSDLDVRIALKSRVVKTQDLLDRTYPSGQFPERVRVVTAIEITVNNRALYVPRSTHSDLLDVRNAELALTGQSGILTLKGGDASESFLTTITFDKTAVKRRSFFSSLLPDKPLQETIYYLRGL